MGSELKHTHYFTTEPPRQVPGTLLDCAEEDSHRVEGSELWADYLYSPRFGPHSATGLPQAELVKLMAAYTGRRSSEITWRIADVVADEEYTYRVRITNRTLFDGDGPAWHTEEWGIHDDGQWHGIPKNPHPPFRHEPPWCSNCGY